MFNDDFGKLNEVYPKLLLQDETYVEAYKKQIEKVLSLGCENLQITGINEPLQNIKFLRILSDVLSDNKFKNFEIQTSGVNLTEEMIEFLVNELHITTFAISVNSIDDKVNSKFFSEKANVKLQEIVKNIKHYNVKLRFCYNLLDTFTKYTPEEIIKFSKELMIDEILFRKMYGDDTDKEESIYVKEHKLNDELFNKYYDFVTNHDIKEYTIHGVPVYDVEGIKTIIESDNKSRHVSVDGKNLLLRTNCKLYDDWDSVCCV